MYDSITRLYIIRVVTITLLLRIVLIIVLIIEIYIIMYITVIKKSLNWTPIIVYSKIDKFRKYD